MSKPRLSVTSLLNKIYGEPEVPTEILLHGMIAHEQVYEAYKKRCQNCEFEVPIEMDRGFYILYGKIDIVDHDRGLIIEVKTKNSIRTERARMQLSAYVRMYRELNAPNYYYGVWLVYDWKEPTKFYMVKPFWLDMTILETLDKIAHEVLGDRNEEGDKDNR